MLEKRKTIKVLSILIFAPVSYIKTHKKTPNLVNHTHNTSKKNSINLVHKPNYSGMKLLHVLPGKLHNIKKVTKFKNEVKMYLVEFYFNIIDSYLSIYIILLCSRARRFAAGCCFTTYTAYCTPLWSIVCSWLCCPVLPQTPKQLWPLSPRVCSSLPWACSNTWT